MKGMIDESGGKKLTYFEIFIFKIENLVLDSLIYLETVERFKNRSNMMKFGSFGDNTIPLSIMVGAIALKQGCLWSTVK